MFVCSQWCSITSQDFHHICTFSEFSFKCFSLNLRMDGWEPRFPHTCLQFYTFHHNNYTCVSKSPFLILPYSHFSLTYYAVCYVCSSVCRTATFIPFFKVTLWLAAFFFFLYLHFYFLIHYYTAQVEDCTDLFFSTRTTKVWALPPQQPLLLVTSASENVLE